MLGKTNIIALSESAAVSSIEDYKWTRMQAGIYSNFKKAAYHNGYLAAITMDGNVAYTTDGEVWETSKPGYTDCRINDIEWDGSRFILAGSYMDGRTSALLLATTDFKEYSRIDVENSSNDGDAAYDIEYFAVYHVDGKYIVIAYRKHGGTNSVYLYAGKLDSEWDMEKSVNLRAAGSISSIGIEAVKNSSEMLLFVHSYNIGMSSNSWNDEIIKVNSIGEPVSIYNLKSGATPYTNVFECKDALFYQSIVSEESYKLVKVLASNETSLQSTGQDFSFVDAVYFDGCQVFINIHEMLVVRKGEGIADKTVGDLVEIAPELTLNCITKAFGQLYIFGNQGVILKSSAEAGSGEAIAVQAISAKKALNDAKAYTDSRYAELEARIAKLEVKQ